MYDKKLIDFVRKHYPISDPKVLTEKYINEFHPNINSKDLEKEINKDIKSLIYDFIGNPYFKIIDDDCLKNKKVMTSEDLKLLIGNELNYRLELLGQYFY